MSNIAIVNWNNLKKEDNLFSILCAPTLFSVRKHLKEILYNTILSVILLELEMLLDLLKL